MQSAVIATQSVAKGSNKNAQRQFHVIHAMLHNLIVFEDNVEVMGSIKQFTPDVGQVMDQTELMMSLFRAFT